MPKFRYDELPQPPLKGRQEVRDLLYELFANWDTMKLVELFEGFVNAIIDIAVREAKENWTKK